MGEPWLSFARLDLSTFNFQPATCNATTKELADRLQALVIACRVTVEDRCRCVPADVRNL